MTIRIINSSAGRRILWSSVASWGGGVLQGHARPIEIQWGSCTCWWDPKGHRKCVECNSQFRGHFQLQSMVFDLSSRLMESIVRSLGRWESEASRNNPELSCFCNRQIKRWKTYSRNNEIYASSPNIRFEDVPALVKKVVLLPLRAHVF